MTTEATVKNTGYIVGIGSPLVDMLIKVDESFIASIGAVKGGMVYVSSSVIDRLAEESPEKPVIVTGGSACNTIIGAARLGSRGRFIGKLGKGAMGGFFMEDLKKANIDPFMLFSDTPTGRVLSVITPDAQRTLLTYLGASAEMTPEDITDACFKDAAVIHIEGYLVFNRALIESVMKAAKASGALISLDLASHTVVKNDKRFLHDLVSEYVDILIANEDEAFAYTGFEDDQKALEVLSEGVKYAVLKFGERGSRIAHDGSSWIIEPAGSGGVIDTTGAGDLWNSGFLHGLVNGFDPETCGKIGSKCGYEVCCVMGAKIHDEGWERIMAAFPNL